MLKRVEDHDEDSDEAESDENEDEHSKDENGKPKKEYASEMQDEAPSFDEKNLALKQYLMFHASTSHL